MASLVAIMIHQQKMNDVWLSQKVKPALPHFQFQKRAPAAVRDRERSSEQGWGAALSGLRDWQMCGSFSGLLGPKYLPSPASIPTPPCPTHLGGFRTPNLHRLQRLSLLLGKLAFPRLPPVYRKSLRNNWRLPGCFFPPACFLCRSYSESLGLGCWWGDSQTSLSRWKSVFIHKLPRNLWVGRKKKPKHQGKKKDKTKTSLTSPSYRQGYQEYHP